MSADEFRAFTDGVLSAPGLGGLEIPFVDSGSPWQSQEYLGTAPRHARHVLTLVPAMVAGLVSRAAFGLASVDEGARAAAVETVRAAWTFVQETNSQAGGTIADIELHTAPGGGSSSAVACARSLQEISGWDWADVALAIEHCDSESTDHVPEKGYLPLEQELQLAEDHGLGIVINWGRSAIERRGAEGAFDHIDTVATRGLLAGVVFSGCSPVASEYGEAWADRHLPVRAWSSSDLAGAARTSLLTVGELDRCVQRAVGAPELRFLGIKVGSPTGAVLDERVGLVAANLAILRDSIERSATPTS